MGQNFENTAICPESIFAKTKMATDGDLAGPPHVHAHVTYNVLG